MKTGKLYPLGSFNANSMVKVYDKTIGNGNLLTNGNFEGWVGGVNVAPDGWTQVLGSCAREGTTIKISTYSAKKSGHASADLRQSIHALKGIAYWKGKIVTLGCWIYSATASRGRVHIYDGVTSSVTYHTSAAAWQWVTVTATVGASATELTLILDQDGGGVDVYYDGAICVEGSSIASSTDLNNWDATSLTISGLNGNLLTNSDFETWTAGASAAPDGWSLEATNPTIARESSTIKLGTYSCKLTRGAAQGAIKQAIHAEKGITYWQGKTVTFGCWVKCNTASLAQIYIGDGVGANATYHTGDNTWQWLTVTHTVAATATSVTLFFYMDLAGDAYFDGAICMEASTVPQTTSSNIGLYCLNGDTAGKYLLKARVVNGYNGASDAGVRLNNDSGANYGYQYLAGLDTAVSAGRGTTATKIDGCVLTALGNIGMFEICIHAKSGYVRTAKHKYINDVVTTTVTSLLLQGASWNNTADNITSLVITATQANGLGIGTHIELWQPQYSV